MALRCWREILLRFCHRMKREVVVRLLLVALFQEFIQLNTLRDLSFKGPQFTWRIRSIFERLDRAIENLEWFRLFASTVVYHLSHLKLDHRPILISKKPSMMSRLIRPFNFLASWASHPSFSQLARESWKHGTDVSTSLHSRSSDLWKWNKEVYGHIGKRKRDLARRIGSIQMALDRRCSKFLLDMELDLRIEYEKTLDEEELLWRQKSRVEWFQQGDRNTKFFHNKTLR